MRGAVSADNDNGLDSVVSAHFGRCPYFVLLDLEEREEAEMLERQLDEVMTRPEAMGQES